MHESLLLDLKHDFSISWLDCHARRDSGMLAAVDIETGDHVAVLARNSTDVFEMLFSPAGTSARH